ncbi:unnamed protein product [Meloidogyne enterolobii]|uniref:Uncharacterized protein n=1 Tax=Meloidogyne enterolobii TaxID=390850 RepID=A0ACB0Y1P9_MELEN
MAGCFCLHLTLPLKIREKQIFHSYFLKRKFFVSKQILFFFLKSAKKRYGKCVLV